MDKIDINNILNRNNIYNEIKNFLDEFYNSASINQDKNSNKSIKQKKSKTDSSRQTQTQNLPQKNGLYIYGDSGIGKTKFVLNLLNDLNYDIIYYDNSIIRNKHLIENLCSNNISSNNVYSLLCKKPKKMVIVIDDIYGMNTGDKNGLVALIKLIRIKKTKKQKLENITLNPIICINNHSSDKKILELKKVCKSIELIKPTDDEILTIINNILPNLFRYSKNENKIIQKNIISFINNNLTLFDKIFFYEENNLIYKKFYTFNVNCEKNIFKDIKYITQNLLNTFYNFDKINNILESNRTVLSLLFHENIIYLLHNSKNNLASLDNLNLYLKILDNFIYSDYIDRIIFQKQIWQLTEINYIIKLFYNNYLLYSNNLLTDIDIDKIIFTKVLTKYSSEFNNYVFIYNLLQIFLLDKKDIYCYFYKYYQNINIIDNFMNLTNILNELTNYNISKLEIVRIFKFFYNLDNYNIIENKKDIYLETEYDDII